MSVSRIRNRILNDIEKHNSARNRLKRSWDERLQSEFHRGVIHEAKELLTFINEVIEK